MRRIIPLNHGWEYTEAINDCFILGEADGQAEITKVSLPHTTRVTPLNYFDESEYQTVCGYRRRLRLPDGRDGKTVFLMIGAAAHEAEVYLDGERLAVHKGGYTAFRVDLSGRLSNRRDSLLCIRVDSRESLNIPPFGNVIDYMTYGGLYREVWLELRAEHYIDDVFAVPTIPDTVRVAPDSSPADIAAVTFDGTVSCQLKLVNHDGLAIRQRVYPYGIQDTAPLAERIFHKGDICTLTVPGARLWDIESPVLYTLRTELLDDSTVIDRVDTVIGFRRSEFCADGYFLNGRRVKLRGLNRHQSYPYVGYAMPRSMQRCDADILKKELGLNAVRTSHYPQSPHFIHRCDELGLLVFTEIPGWQHIGDAAWKDIAVQTVEEMILQYRNHPSVILWGMRINESPDDDAFYTRTNAAAHRLDPTRPTGGVRYIKKSHLLEDVYTYNDFSHDGTAPGCEAKKNVTSDPAKPYLISEYCGHMFPTKSYDNEARCAELALRHARVLNDVAAQEDICGAFGWCFFDYNTHRDFGSGDRICYHGVCDMFRNPKLAASVYAAQQDSAPVLEISSSMDIGEHPASVRGPIYAFTNADSVRFYKNDTYICDFAAKNEAFSALLHPPIRIDDFIGDRIKECERFTRTQAKYTKDILNDAAVNGMNGLSTPSKLKAAQLMLRYRMRFEDAYQLYGKYIANWGDSASTFRFEAIKDGEVVKTAVKAPFTARKMELKVSHTLLIENETYDVASIRIRMTDQNGNTLTRLHTTAKVTITGPLEQIGPADAPIIGGMGGLYVRTTGAAGDAALTIEAERIEAQTIRFHIAVGEANTDKEDQNVG